MIGLVITVGAFLVAVVAKEADAAAVGVLALLATVLLFVGSTVTTIGTKKIGVVTSFNKPVDAYDNGWHWKAPWEKVTELDGAIQTDNYVCHKDWNPDRDMLIRIGNQSLACINVTIRWRLKEDAADDLFKDYRSFSHIRDSLVTRDLVNTLNDVFASYNPLGGINQTKAVPPPSLDSLAEKVKESLREQIGEQIEVLSVQTPIIRHDPATQTKINQYQAAQADTRIALQKVQTAQNEKKANQILSTSVSNDPNVLVSKCLDTLNEMVKSDNAVPAGFSCWPGGSSPVVITAGK